MRPQWRRGFHQLGVVHPDLRRAAGRPPHLDEKPIPLLLLRRHLVIGDLGIAAKSRRLGHLLSPSRRSGAELGIRGGVGLASPPSRTLSQLGALYKTGVIPGAERATQPGTHEHKPLEYGFRVLGCAKPRNDK